MAVNFSAYSIRRPIPSILLFIVLCLLGIVSFMQLPVTRFPNIDVPVVSVTVTQSGAAPSELETQVAKRIEDSLAGVTGVKRLITTLNDGRSVTIVEFQLEVNVEKALNDVKDAVAKIRAELPRTVDEPIIEKIVQRYPVKRVIAVADRGLLSIDNLAQWERRCDLRHLRRKPCVAWVTEATSRKRPFSRKCSCG